MCLLWIGAVPTRGCLKMSHFTRNRRIAWRSNIPLPSGKLIFTRRVKGRNEKDQVFSGPQGKDHHHFGPHLFGKDRTEKIKKIYDKSYKKLLNFRTLRHYVLPCKILFYADKGLIN